MSAAAKPRFKLRACACGRTFDVSSRHPNQKSCSPACGRAFRPKRARYVWTDATEALVRAGYERGDDARVIAAEIGVSTLSIYNLAASLGIKHWRQGRSLKERFFDYVSPDPDSGCWLWRGSYDHTGYGQIRIARRGPGSLRRATHVALELHGTPVPPGLRALHRCDNPPCVNPEHLFIGNQKDNVADMIAKGRGSRPPISVKGQGRLTSHCAAGHLLSVADIYVDRRGVQACKICRRAAKAAMRARLKAAGLTSRGTVPVVGLS